MRTYRMIFTFLMACVLVIPFIIIIMHHHILIIFHQILLLELLNKWGWEGFDEHVKEVRHFYQSQRDLMLAAAHKHLSGNTFIDLFLFSPSSPYSEIHMSFCFTFMNNCGESPRIVENVPLLCITFFDSEIGDKTNYLYFKKKFVQNSQNISISMFILFLFFFNLAM